MSEASEPTPEGQGTTKKNTLRKLLGFVVIAAVAYFANVEIQSYLGRLAFDETGLAEIPLTQALEAAGKENKLVLADMSAIWCPACRKLDKQVLGNADVQKAINADYVFTRIEFESAAGEAFMDKYNVTGFPTLLILSPNGDLVRKVPVDFDPAVFIKYL